MLLSQCTQLLIISLDQIYDLKNVILSLLGISLTFSKAFQHTPLLELSKKHLPFMSEF